MSALELIGVAGPGVMEGVATAAAAAAGGAIDPALIHISAAQARALKAWFVALNWGSLVLGLLTFAVNLANAKKRTFPARLTT